MWLAHQDTCKFISIRNDVRIKKTKYMQEEQNIKQSITEISKRIEAILFWKGEPVNKKDLQKLLVTDSETNTLLSNINSDINIAIDLAIEDLKSILSNRGLCLIQIEDNYTLRTSSSMSGLIEKLQIEELNKDLGKATTETLALIIYKGPIKRSEIDNIRGVNSSYILRNLMIRGLIDKEVDPKNSRTNIYKPSFELLSYLGVTSVETLPNYQEVVNELNKFNEDFNTTESKSE
jgi:segregation and condensation protein B